MGLIDIGKGRNHVLGMIDAIVKGSNELMDMTLNKPKTKFKECNAEVKTANGVAATGSYDSVACTHAELNALAAYVSQGGDLAHITAIEVTSPPCKSCNFVLYIHGLRGKVKTTGKVSKNYTGSWKWPENLKDPAKFNANAWNGIKVSFGAEQGKALTNMVHVISFLSVN